MRVFKSEVFLKNKTKSDVFDFFSDERNLEKITPPNLNFRVIKKTTPEIQKGTLIYYKLRLYGLPFKWVTLIKEWEKNNMFMDVQLKGPYKVWQHTHKFEDVEGGVLIKDEVHYKLPLGFMGDLVAGWLVKKDVENIFNYRSKYILENLTS